MLERIKNEPVMLKEILVAALGLGAAFGLDLSAERTAAILLMASAVLALFVRQRVTPVK